MKNRVADLAAVRRLLGRFPVVAIVGPRQIGKTTLARAVADAWRGDCSRFDLERPSDLARLDDPETTLEPLRGLVVLDEVQRRPDLFTVLRPLADRRRTPARFLVLGSAAPTLLRQGAESLAGRIAFHELDGFGLDDFGADRWRRLWIRGGFPRSALSRDDRVAFEWRENLMRTFVERDVPQLGIRLAASTLERFWTMLAHCHGQTWNGSELARSFGVSDKTVRDWLDVLESTFMVRTLRPWTENVGKRVVKAPRIYVADTGLLHSLLRVATADELSSHPKLGASFEGFALGQVARRVLGGSGNGWRDCYFWATHQGAELDLLVVRGGRRLGFEFKHTAAPRTTRSMVVAMKTLGLSRIDVIHAGSETYPLASSIRAVSIRRVDSDIEPITG